MGTQAIRVFLIDDHRTILWGLEKLIESVKPKMTVVGRSTSSIEALARLPEAAPDVVLLDLDLGHENGLDAIPQLLVSCSGKILVLTGVRDEAVHRSAILAGARGVVVKEARAEVILAAITKVHEGEVWLDRAATGKLLVEVTRRNLERHAEDAEQAKISALTAREREIVALTAANAGATARTIAEKLHISEHTLRNHLTSIYDKLGVANRLELFAYVQEHSLARPVPKR